MSVALGLGGCSFFQSSVKEVQPAGNVEGQQVEVGFFKHADQAGQYVLVRRVADLWQTQSITPDPAEVPEGSELLFVRKGTNGAIAVTPAYPDESRIDEPTQLFTCDEPLPGYGPCRSVLVTNTPPPLKRAGIDRESVLKVLREAGVVSKVTAIWAENAKVRALDKTGADVRANVSVNVHGVKNMPGLLSLAPDDVRTLAVVSSARVNQEGKASSVGVRFNDLKRHFPVGDVECHFAADQNEYPVDAAAATKATSISVEATVVSCAVLNPHPDVFKAKAADLTAEVREFDAHHSARVLLVNPSSEFISATSVSVYYFGKIFSLTGITELPPRGEREVRVPIAASDDATLIQVTAANAGEKDFEFGIAVKYGGGKSAERTLFDQQKFSVKRLFPTLPIPPRAD